MRHKPRTAQLSTCGEQIDNIRGRHRRSTTVSGPVQQIHSPGRGEAVLPAKGPCGLLNERFTVDLYWRHKDEKTMTEIADTFDSAFTKAVNLGNRLADKDKDADHKKKTNDQQTGTQQY